MCHSFFRRNFMYNETKEEKERDIWYRDLQRRHTDDGRENSTVVLGQG